MRNKSRDFLHTLPWKISFSWDITKDLCKKCHSPISWHENYSCSELNAAWTWVMGRRHQKICERVARWIGGKCQPLITGEKEMDVHKHEHWIDVRIVINPKNIGSAVREKSKKYHDEGQVLVVSPAGVKIFTLARNYNCPTCKKNEEIIIRKEKFILDAAFGKDIWEEILETVNAERLKKPFKCQFCEARFDEVNKLHAHVEASHEKFVCMICGQIFENKNVLKEHVRIKHEEEKIFLCTECNSKKLRSRKSHFQHLYQAHEKYFCIDCEIVFDNKKRFLEHERDLHERYHCPWCILPTFSNATALSQHVYKKHSMIMCSFCLKIFEASKIHEYQEHVLSKHGLHVCPHCKSKFFKTKNSLEDHMSQKHSCS